MFYAKRARFGLARMQKRCKPVNRVEIAKIFTYPTNHFLSTFTRNIVSRIDQKRKHNTLQTTL